MRYNLKGYNSKNVLFVIPPLSEIYPNSVEDAEEVDVIHPSLGILYLSSYIKKHGYNPVVLDHLAKRVGNNVREMIDLIKELKIGIVFITCMTANYEVALQYAIGAKSEGRLVVLGGPHASCCAYSVIQSPYIDIVSEGEGEQTTLELLNALYASEDINKVAGVVFLENGHVVRMRKRARISDLDRIPIPDYIGINMSPYIRTQSLGMISSRGCPNNCLFCSSRCIWGNRIAYRSINNIIEEMDFLCGQYNYAGKELLFYDDNITLNRKRLKALCDSMIDREYNFKWKCMSRVDTISSEMLESMKKAGCYSISFGVESANEYSLNMTNKNISIEKVEQAITMCKEAGIIFHGYFMIGFPWETKRDFMDTVSFICSHSDMEASLSVLTPYPGTSFFDEREKWNIEIDEDWRKYNHISSAIKCSNFDAHDIYAAFSVYLLEEERKRKNESTR